MECFTNISSLMFYFRDIHGKIYAFQLNGGPGETFTLVPNEARDFIDPKVINNIEFSLFGGCDATHKEVSFDLVPSSSEHSGIFNSPPESTLVDDLDISWDFEENVSLINELMNQNGDWDNDTNIENIVKKRIIHEFNELQFDHDNSRQNVESVCDQPLCSNLVNLKPETKINVRSVADLKLTSKNVQKKIKSVYEKRPILKKESFESISEITTDFFKDSNENLRVKIRPMSHSKRFWLSVKFHGNLETGLSQAKLCNLFGVGRHSINKFISNHKITCENFESEFKKYNGLSPVEMPKTFRRFRKELTKIALNPEVLDK